MIGDDAMASMGSDNSEIIDAAFALAEADWVLVASGAGLSADSGLDTYEGLRDQGVDYDILCRAELLYDKPALFHSFWLGSLLKYRGTAPHEGFQILENLLRERADMGRVYLYTSNVDGHLRHWGITSCSFTSFDSLFPWVPPAPKKNTGSTKPPCLFANRGQLQGFPLCEIHGCCEDWMCSSHLAPPPSEGLSQRWITVCEEQRKLLDGQDARAACGSPEAFKLPSDASLDMLVCSCGLPLRPAVLMFGDEDEALLDILRQAWETYQRWEDGMERELKAGGRLVILEIGVGHRVEVIRQECDEVLKDVAAAGGTVTLIRINLDEQILSKPLAADGTGRIRKICLQLSSLEALKLIGEVNTTTASQVEKMQGV